MGRRGRMGGAGPLSAVPLLLALLLLVEGSPAKAVPPVSGRRSLQEAGGAVPEVVGMVVKFEEELSAETRKEGQQIQLASATAQGGRSEALECPPTDVELLQRQVVRQKQRIADLLAEFRLEKEASEAIGTTTFPKMPQPVYVLQNDDPRLWQQRTFRHHGFFGFISYSAYRISPTRITVVGMGLNKAQALRKSGPCHWVSPDGSAVEGTLTIQYGWSTDPMDYPYELMLLECDLRLPEVPPQADEYGVFKSDKAGALRVELEQEVFYPYVEKQGYEVHDKMSSGPFQHQLLYCSPPLYGSHSTPAVTQWISFHRAHLLIDYFVFYDAGAVSAELRAALQPMVDEDLLTITDFREILKYETLMQGQLVAMHDCLLRSREIAKWTLFLDFDEYLVIPGGIQTLVTSLKDAAYISHGSYLFSTQRCDSPDPWDPAHHKFAVEMMTHRAKDPFCVLPDVERHVCSGSEGHRKVIYNPRKVLQVRVHEVHRRATDVGGNDISANNIFHGHFRGLQVENGACGGDGLNHSTPFHQWIWPEYFANASVIDDRIATIAARARACAEANFKDKALCKKAQSLYKV